MLNGIISRLKSQSTVTDWVRDQVHEVAEARQAHFPYIRVSMLSSIAHDDKDGPSDLDIYSIQVDAFSDKSASEARKIAGVMRTALERYSGTEDGVVIQSIRYISETTFHNFDGSYPGEFAQSQDYSVRVTR